MKIFIIRHGQTDWNVESRLQGKTDIELNEVGMKQAEEIGEKLKNVNIDLILSSPLKRTLKTAEIINRDRMLPIVVCDELIERGFGEFEGKSDFDEYNCSFENLIDIDLNYNQHGVETMQRLIKRVYEFMDSIKEKYKNKSVLIVSHGVTILAIQCYLRGIPEDKNIIKLALDNGECREFDIT